MRAVPVLGVAGTLSPLVCVIEEEGDGKSDELKTVVHAKQHQYPQIKQLQNAGQIPAVSLIAEKSKLTTEEYELRREKVQIGELHQRHPHQK